MFLDCAAGIAVNSTGHSHPGRREGDHRAGAEVPAHVGHRLLLRAAGAARRGAGGDRADSAAACGRFSATPAPKRSKRASSWRATRPAARTSSRSSAAFHGRTHGLAVADGEQGDSAARLRSADARRLSRAVSGPLSAAARARRRRAAPTACLDFIEHQLFAHLVSPDEVAAIVVEPIQGEGGYVVAPDEFLQRLRELTNEARHPARRRRSAVGHGTDREDVRDRVHRRRAGHDGDREGDRVGAAARRRGRRAPG